MALIKSTTLPNGTTAEYWIASPSMRKDSEVTLVDVYLYRDSAAAAKDESGKRACAPILRQNCGWLAGTWHTPAEVYAYLKTLDSFTGAVDG